MNANLNQINVSETDLCNRFARILEGRVLESRDGLCVVARRRNLSVEIAGRPTQSPLVLDALFSFESMDTLGRTLNLGETVILQEEINRFIRALQRQGILVTALHNHWLFETPRLMYIHFFSIDEPLSFARKVARAFRLLEDNAFDDDLLGSLDDNFKDTFHPESPKAPNDSLNR
ncbi:DUF1259 domain-containing protein [Fonticella tunisiensis]